ncbi:MAG TPA: M23 family metallopeptidase [Nannocystaceae bacterium]|nr:M23 family metallopeptidase [Nannocystaceae bacterium]
MTNTLRLAGLTGLVLAACEVSSDDVRTVDATTPRDGANGVVRWTAGKGVNVRAEPRADSTKIGGLAEGAQLVVGCQIEGQSVQGNTIWDYVPAKQGYVADAFVDTGWPSWIPGVPKCGADDGCGDVDYFGECDGDTLVWCEHDALRTVDCGARVCAWRNDDIGFDCVNEASGGRLGIGGIVGGAAFSVSQDYGPTSFDGGYSYCHAYTDYGGLFHCGIDIAIPDGTPLFAGEDATVVIVGSDYFEDWNVPWAANSGELRLETAAGTHIIYGHMSRIDVHEGDDLAAGDATGLSGYANGDHVHIEVRELDPSFASGYRSVDPVDYFGW